METTSAVNEIERFLKIRKWKRDVNSLGEVSYISPDSEWCVELSGDGDGCCAIRKFTDSDIDGIATGRYVTELETETLAELKEGLVSIDAMPWECPNCGEDGGEPRTKYSRYLYGADADGNRGEWRDEEEEGCSKCIRSRQ
jgi:hypothetical protein